MRSVAETMTTIRALETRLQALCDSGECKADLHPGTGQEAIAASVCAALGPEDMVVCHHRMVPWAVALGVPLLPLVAELLGKAGGLHGGHAGEMHLSLPQYRLAHTFQLVGTTVPVAAGVAWALKQRGKGGIAVAVIGDAATANGQFHEGVNIAAVMGLPLLVVVENNGVAGNVRSEQYMPVGPAVRAEAYGTSGYLASSDIAFVPADVERAVWEVRLESCPVILEFPCGRLGRHKQGMGDLRAKEEMAALWARDPLRGVEIDYTEVDSILASVRAMPDAA